MGWLRQTSQKASPWITIAPETNTANYTRARILNEVGVQTPTFVHFSTLAGAAEVEQSAFGTGVLVDGIDFSDDKRLQGPDTLLFRHAPLSRRRQLPINAPQAGVRTATNQPVEGHLDRYQTRRREDDYAQAGVRYRTFETWERDESISNLVNDMKQRPEPLALRLVWLFLHCDEEHGSRVPRAPASIWPRPGRCRRFPAALLTASALTTRPIRTARPQSP